MMLWGLALLAGVIALPLVIEARRKPMDEAARHKAPGRCVRLSQGVTHYQWTGAERAPIVVCIHGLTTPSFVWQSVATGLAAAGFRVLTYDLYGRGFSDRPSGLQTPAFFLKQLDDLLENQRVGGEVTVIGYSMGGAIATAYAARKPHAISQVILLAPAGMQAVGAKLRFMVQTPVLGLWLMLLRYPSLLRKGLRAEADLPTSVPQITKLQDAELDYRGFVPAVHSSLRGMLTDSFQPDHAALHKEGIPILAIWGAEDDVIPLTAKETLAKWNPDVQHHVIAGAGHGVTYTHTPQVLALIQDFTQEA